MGMGAVNEKITMVYYGGCWRNGHRQLERLLEERTDIHYSFRRRDNRIATVGGRMVDVDGTIE